MPAGPGCPPPSPPTHLFATHRGRTSTLRRLYPPAGVYRGQPARSMAGLSVTVATRLLRIPPARRARPADPGNDEIVTLASVPVARQPISKLELIVGEYRWRRLLQTAHEFREHFRGRVFWNVSSTATGGGVAEMLRTLVGYV